VIPPLIYAISFDSGFDFQLSVFNTQFPTWLYRALMFLVVSCPCALVISVPLSFFGGIGGASRKGILIKGANYMDVLAKVDTVVFDKTGTLTHGRFAVEAVHPERYALVEKMAASVGTDVETLMKDKELRAKINLQDFVTPDCGLPTLQDIMKELEKPGLDPRAKFEVFEFDKNVTRIEDVHEGMILPGIVTNITAFGAFVDIGVHQDGLIHVSQMANRRVNDPGEVVHLHQHLKVKVLEVDLRRHRISLTLKGIE
jgi:hypothetical protein